MFCYCVTRTVIVFLQFFSCHDERLLEVVCLRLSLRRCHEKRLLEKIFYYIFFGTYFHVEASGTEEEVFVV